MRLSAANSNSSNGWAPGTIDVTNQRAESITAPARSAGTKTSRDYGRLPRPDGPTTVMNRCGDGVASPRSTSLLDQPLSTVEVPGVGLLERVQALVRVPPLRIPRPTHHRGDADCANPGASRRAQSLGASPDELVDGRIARSPGSLAVALASTVLS